MPVSCPECSGRIPAEDINIQAALAKCAACASVFTLAEAARTRERPLVGLPSGIYVARTASTLVLTRRWFGPTVIILGLFTAAWDAFLIFWYSMAFGGKAPWIAIVFPIVHVAVGLGLTYFVIASLFNKTIVRVDSFGLGVRHGPIPWKGNRYIRRGDVRQLFCKAGEGEEAAQFAIQVLLHNGQAITLVERLDKAQARYIEQEVEAYLGITDSPVEGEAA